MQNERGLIRPTARGPCAFSPSRPWGGIRGTGPTPQEGREKELGVPTRPDAGWMRAFLVWVGLGAIVTMTMACGSRQEARSAVYYNGGTPDSDRGILTGAAAKTARSCTNDESCSFGEYCVRPQFSMTGYCAIPIDGYGKQALYPQHLPSISPNNRGDCRNATDCPIGLHCDDQIGSTAHCVR